MKVKKNHSVEDGLPEDGDIHKLLICYGFWLISGNAWFYTSENSAALGFRRRSDCKLLLCLSERVVENMSRYQSSGPITNALSCLSAWKLISVPPVCRHFLSLGPVNSAQVSCKIRRHAHHLLEVHVPQHDQSIFRVTLVRILS